MNRGLTLDSWIFWRNKSVLAPLFFAAILTALPVGRFATEGHAQDSGRITAPSASVSSIVGTWRGYYYYNADRPPVDFLFQFEDDHGQCRGHSDEPETFGTDECPRQRAILLCDSLKLEPNKKITIRKRYDGCGRQTHGIHYSGVVWADLRQITGEWTLAATKGTFLMRR